MLETFKDIVWSRLGRLLFQFVLVASAFLVMGALIFGTDALVALGLSRSTAGTVVGVVVVAGVVYGLYWFATRMIDW